MVGMPVGPYFVELFEDTDGDMRIRSIIVRDPGHHGAVAICNTHDLCARDTREANLHHLLYTSALDPSGEYPKPELVPYRDELVAAYDRLIAENPA